MPKAEMEMTGIWNDSILHTLDYTASIHKYVYGKSSKCRGSGWKVPQIVTYISENILMTSSASMTGAEAGRSW